MGRIPRSMWGAVCMVVVLGLASAAAAQPARSNYGSDGVRFDIHLNFGLYGAFGAGFHVDIPIIADGFLRPGSIEDDFSISFGADLFFWDYFSYDYDYCFRNAAGEVVCEDGYDDIYLVIAAPVVAQWNLYLNQSWSIFPEAGVVIIFGDHWRDNYYRGRRGFHLDPVLGFGARYHFSQRNALLMRISWPAGFSIGITF